MRRSLSVLALLAAVFAFQCNDPRVADPALRSRATQFLDLSGSIDSSIDVRVEVEYHTYDPKCDITVNRLEGVKSPRIYHHPVQLVRKGNSYSAALPLDIVAEPVCRWQPWSINYTVFTNDGRPHKVPIPPTPLVWFQDESPQSIAPFTVTCRMGHDLECEKPLGNYFLGREARQLNVSFSAMLR